MKRSHAGMRLAALALFVLSGGIGPGAQSPEPDPVALLARVDANELYDTISYAGEMVIEYKGKRFVKEFKAFGRENRDSFIEFTNSEDAGTKYLKKDGRLFVYSPDTEQVMPISGHMLKESMMGSDLSYEDAIENDGLAKRYVPTLAGSDSFDGRDVWVLDLEAIKKTESYPRQRLFIAKDTLDCLHYELYALSGARLKEYNLIRIEQIGSRRFPVESEMRDFLRKGSRTLFRLGNVEIDKPIADSVFSTRNLK